MSGPSLPDFEQLKRLRKPEPWLSIEGLISATLLCLVVALALLRLVDLGDPANTTAFRLYTIVGILIFVPTSWFVISQIYLRTGKGLKVGLVDTLSDNELKDWSEIRDILRVLMHEGQAKEYISLRLVPRASIRTPICQKNFIKRYKFDLLIQTHKSASPQALFQFTILNKEVIASNQFMAATISHLQHLLSNRKASAGIHDMAGLAARNLHEAFVFLCGGMYFTRQDYDSALPLLVFLEKRLSDSIAIHERPRAQVRWLIKACYTAPTTFDMSKSELPQHDALVTHEQRLNDAIAFDPTDVGLHTQKARIQFLLGKVEDAVNTVERAGNLSPEKHQDATVMLDRAFLNLISSNFDRSAECYEAALRSPGAKQFNYFDLVSFADLCADWQYSHIIFIQYLYRLLGGIPVPEPIAQSAKAWLVEDTSRSKLSALVKTVNDKVCSLIDTTKSTSGTRFASPKHAPKTPKYKKRKRR